MLEATAIIAVLALMTREFLALGAQGPGNRAVRLAGWVALPFLLAFSLLFLARVLGYLGVGVGAPAV